MRILLTGPCGSVGIRALELLTSAESQYDIVAFEKKSPLSEKVLAPFKDKITLIYGDLRHEDSLQEATMGIDFVIHLAAIIPPLADHDTELAQQVNVHGTEHLLRKIKENSPSAFFLFTSSVSVYGDRLLSDGIAVGDPLTPSLGDYYAETKIQAEKLVVESGLAYSIFRLTGVMGPRPGDDRSKVEPLMFHMPLDTKFEFVTTRDCAYATVQAIEKIKEIKGQIFNLSGGDSCRVIYREFLRHAFSISGIDIDNFPAYSFAEQNFHCAYYKDADKLNDILHFQRDTLQSYYEWTDPEPKPFQRFIVKLFQKSVIKKIASQSDVLQAVKERDMALMKRFLREIPQDI